MTKSKKISTTAIKKTVKKSLGKKSGHKSAKDWVKAIVIALLLLLVFRTFIGQSFTVTSSRMEKAVMSGDHVYINKLSLGARMPVTILTIPFTENTLPFSSIPSFFDWITLPVMRIPGYSHVKHNDMLVFNYPYENDVPVDMKTRYVKRCVALSGDSIRIYNKTIFLNNVQIQSDSNNIQFRYRIVFKKGSIVTDKFWEKYNINEGNLSAERVYDCDVTLNQAYTLEQDSMITDVRPLKLDKDQGSTIYFPNNEKFNWNTDFFGPVKVPKKKDSVLLTIKNIPIYRRIIETYEKNKLEVTDKQIMINDVETRYYVFKQNYYFVLDDNRDDAKDSRFWGFLPEDHIIGKASFIWFSFNNSKSGSGKVRWNRIFKRL